MLLRKASQLPRPRMKQTEIPAPVGGLNLRDGLANMKRTDALILDNWVVETSYLRLRGGHVSHATGLGAAIRTHMNWSGPGGSQAFAATSSDIYNVTANGAVGAAVQSSLNSANWSFINFTNAGGHWLVAANGTDDVRNYNGTTWSTPVITGATSAGLCYVHHHKARLWFLENNSTKAWYLEPQSIAGAAAYIEVGEQLKLGGKLVAVGSVSRDGGSGGSDDLLVFVSSRGEVVIYEGDDPTSINTWQRLGTFYAAAPIGTRCVVQVGGDLGILTEAGILSCRQLMVSDDAAAKRTAITNKINRGIAEAFRSYGTLAGWSMTVYPRGHLLILNVPTSTTTANQYVMNTQTGAWSTFSGFNATCWGLLAENLYFGTSAGTIWRGDYGKQDNGGAIRTEYKSSFQKLNNGATFRMTKIRPHYTSGNRVSPAVKIDVDYRDSTPTIPTDQYPAYSPVTGALWGSGIWGVDLWGEIGNPVSDWVDASGIGSSAALHMVTSTDGYDVLLNATDVQFESASVLAL